MKIDLIYNYRAIDSVYVIYGPEKVNGNIVVLTEGYIVNSISEVINKINAMVATLSPEITNCQSISSGLYGNMNMQIWRGDLNVGSDVPDYTQILTNINTNLTNLNRKLVYAEDTSQEIKLIDILINLFNCFSSVAPSSSASNIRSYNINQKLSLILQCFCGNTSDINATSFLRRILICLCGTNSTADNNIINGGLAVKLSQLIAKLQQSVSPNASITDVLSALNTTIDSKQDTTIVNNEVTPLAEINIDVPFEVKNLKKSDVENL